MKIKKLAAQISRTKQMYLLTDAGGKQWAGTSSAIYLLPGNLPPLDSELLTLILDIPPHKAADYYIEEKNISPDLPTKDGDSEEQTLLYDLNCTVIYDGLELLPLNTTNGIMYFVPIKYLSPIEDAENPILCVRHSGTSPVIAAKDGLFLTALFRPQEHKPSFVPWLAELYTGTKAAADVTEIKKFMESKE